MKTSVFSLSAVVAAAAATQNSTVPLVTSTILATSTSTILSCAPTVTNCPVGKVTEVVYATTTICPATAVHPPAPPATVTSVGPSTETAYSTKVYTITSCAPTVTNCPVGKVSSTVVAVPPTIVVPTVVPTAAAPPAGNSTQTAFSTKVYTVLSCAPSVTNCPVGKVTSTLVPWTPSASSASSVPGAPASSPVAVPSAGVPTAPAVPVTPVAVPSAAVPTAPAVPVAPVATGTVVPPNNNTVPFTGGASAHKAGPMLMAFGLFAALL